MGRPTELFARGADWFVASALAQRGESNAFLSVVQDAALTGYAAGAPAGLGLSGARSLLSALGEITYVPDSIADAFESQWADPRAVDPLLLVRRVLETPAVVRGSGPLRKRAAAIPATRTKAVRSTARRRSTRRRLSRV